MTKQTDWNSNDFPHEYEEIGGVIKTGDYVKTFYKKGVTEISEEEYQNSEIFIVGKIENSHPCSYKKHWISTRKLYVEGMGSWYYEEECVKIKICKDKNN